MKANGIWTILTLPMLPEQETPVTCMCRILPLQKGCETLPRFVQRP